jgi:hypothetical protein
MNNECRKWRKTPIAYAESDVKRQYHLPKVALNSNSISQVAVDIFQTDNWQLEGSDVMGLTRGLISCCQSFAPMADIAVALVVFTYGKIDLNTYKYVIMMFNANFKHIR